MKIKLSPTWEIDAPQYLNERHYILHHALSVLMESQPLPSESPRETSKRMVDELQAQYELNFPNTYTVEEGTGEGDSGFNIYLGNRYSPEYLSVDNDDTYEGIPMQLCIGRDL